MSAFARLLYEHPHETQPSIGDCGGWDWAFALVLIFAVSSMFLFAAVSLALGRRAR